MTQGEINNVYVEEGKKYINKGGMIIINQHHTKGKGSFIYNHPLTILPLECKSLSNNTCEWILMFPLAPTTCVTTHIGYPSHTCVPTTFGTIHTMDI